MGKGIKLKAIDPLDRTYIYELGNHYNDTGPRRPFPPRVRKELCDQPKNSTIPRYRYRLLDQVQDHRQQLQIHWRRAAFRNRQGHHGQGGWRASPTSSPSSTCLSRTSPTSMPTMTRSPPSASSWSATTGSSARSTTTPTSSAGRGMICCWEDGENVRLNGGKERRQRRRPRQRLPRRDPRR